MQFYVKQNCGVFIIIQVLYANGPDRRIKNLKYMSDKQVSVTSFSAFTYQLGEDWKPVYPFGRYKHFSYVQTT